MEKQLSLMNFNEKMALITLWKTMKLFTTMLPTPFIRKFLSSNRFTTSPQRLLLETQHGKVNKYKKITYLRFMHILKIYGIKKPCVQADGGFACVLAVFLTAAFLINI